MTAIFNPGNGLQAINIPLFLSASVVQNFSIFSYLSLIVIAFFVIVILVWVFMVIRAAVSYIRSEGDDKQIGESKQRFGRVFWSVSAMFIFVVILSLVSSFIGLGSFWNWPTVLSQCSDGSYYFQKILQNASNGNSDRYGDLTSYDQVCAGNPRNNR